MEAADYLYGVTMEEPGCRRSSPSGSARRRIWTSQRYRDGMDHPAALPGIEISTDREDLICYSFDSSSARATAPHAVTWPRNTRRGREDRQVRR
ncbi:MAG: hypothetical protein MZU91_00360 [Desulfosudis oleivorans]|nr:hypothetical protein [Desulfosudis oleivorans]